MLLVKSNPIYKKNISMLPIIFFFSTYIPLEKDNGN